MKGSKERVCKAFSHEVPDRTPLFEIFQPYQPIHWNICGRNVATDQAMCWDAMADGISWEELIEEKAKAEFLINKFFGLDMVFINNNLSRNFQRPEKTGETTWKRNGIEYKLNEKTKLVVPMNPSEDMADSNKVSEKDLIKEIEEWDGTASEPSNDIFSVYDKVKLLAEKEGIDWFYMGEIGAGTAAAFYPPFQLMWLITNPELLKRWITMKKTRAFRITEKLIKKGYKFISMGGDVSGDKGPFISPTHYHEFILPVIQEHVELIHKNGAKAIYTSDGNHWKIKDDFFFNSNIDGYKEVDHSAGMTMGKLIEAGIDKKICIIGNIDARHILCHGTYDEVRDAVIGCLKLGQKSPGGHILHASHSVHEDVIPENYFTMVNIYREFFGLGPLPA